jgi:hypothetical protein
VFLLLLVDLEEADDDEGGEEVEAFLEVTGERRLV